MNKIKLKTLSEAAQINERNLKNVSDQIATEVLKVNPKKWIKIRHKYELEQNKK